MAEGRGRAEWERTAALMALVNNANPWRTRTLRPADFNPYPPEGGPVAATEGIPLNRGNFKLLKRVFVRGVDGA